MTYVQHVMGSRRALTLVLALGGWGAAIGPAPVAAQDARLAVVHQEYTFADPAGVGLSGYAMTAEELTVVVPVQDWLSAGTAIRMGRATLTSEGGGQVVHSGLVDPTVFARMRLGIVRIVGALSLPAGASTGTSDENVVAALAGYELLPLPMRRWGSGGGYAAEIAVPLRSAGIEVEFSGSVRSHGEFEPFGSVFEYQLGRELRAGLRVGRQLNVWSRVEVGGWAAVTDPDISRRQEVFDPGRRVLLYGLGAFAVRRTSVLLRADVYQRGAGAVPPPGTSTPLPGVTSTPARGFGAVTVETSTLLGSIPLTTHLQARAVETTGEESAALAVLGIGTEIPISLPVPGRTFLSPRLSVMSGDANVADGYESGVTGWGVSAVVRWEAGR